MLSRMLDLLKSAVQWGSRSLIGLVLGFQLVQGMVLPYADSVKNAGMQRLLQAIPGIGSGAGAVTKLMLGSGVLIKNAMGAAAVLLLFLFSIVPLARLFVLYLIYRGVAAVLQPVADKRLVVCLSGAAQAQKMLLTVTASCFLLFAVTIALICQGTNAAYQKGGRPVTAVYEWIRNLTAFFLFLSVMENLLPGQKYGKYIRLFAGMVLILLAVEPFTSGFNLDEMLARSYEDLVIRGEAGELKEQLGATEQKRLGQILSQYEEAVGRDVRELAQSCGLTVMDCRVRIEGDEDSPEFGTVREIAAVLPAQSAQAEKEKQDS